MRTTLFANLLNVLSILLFLSWFGGCIIHRGGHWGPIHLLIVLGTASLGFRHYVGPKTEI